MQRHESESAPAAHKRIRHFAEVQHSAAIRGVGLVSNCVAEMNTTGFSRRTEEATFLLRNVFFEALALADALGAGETVKVLPWRSTQARNP